MVASSVILLSSSSTAWLILDPPSPRGVGARETAAWAFGRRADLGRQRSGPDVEGSPPPC